MSLSAVNMANAKSCEPPSYRGTFVLVHGANHGAWCWRDVRAGLRTAGYQVFTPTLTWLMRSFSASHTPVTTVPP